MENQDKHEFEKLMVGCGEIYKREITKALLKIYFCVLEKYSIGQVQHAFNQHMINPDQGRFFPKPADLMAHLETSRDLDVKDRAEIAWAAIHGAIERVGPYQKLELEDKQALAAVKAIGGWKKLCTCTYDQLIWLKKDFLQTYDTFENAPLETLPKNLPGLVELQKHKLEQKTGSGAITWNE